MLVVRGRSSRLLVLALFACLLGAAEPPTRHAATATMSCATCHQAQAHSQPHSSMGRALLLPESNTTLAAHPQLRFRQGSYAYEINTRDGHSTYSVTDGAQTITVPIQWTFGANAQTYVLEYQGKRYESMVSYYPPANGLALTIGDSELHPRTLLEAFGREIADAETRACFQCHATGALPNATADTPLKLTGLTAGIQCEHCHTGTEQHFQAMSQGKTGAPLPPKLSKLSPEETSNFCGQCHRTWDHVMRGQIRGEFNVRFQPYRLANSKCYDGEDRRLSCTSCHDPHSDPVRGNPTAYDANCLACHSGGRTTANVVTASAAAVHPPANAKVCPKATSDCITCHMPKVQLPGVPLTFTDHQIRIVRNGERYPN